MRAQGLRHRGSTLVASLTFVGPGNALTGAAPYLAVLRRLGPVWSRSDVKKVFVDGDEVCVIYDFVTDTPAGAVPIVEWLRVQDGQIASVTLFFDRRNPRRKKGNGIGVRRFQIRAANQRLAVTTTCGNRDTARMLFRGLRRLRQRVFDQSLGRHDRGQGPL